MSNNVTKSNPTSADVARLAQVSQSAVSRTFTPGGSVSKATREKVMQAAEALGYRPNALARAMTSGKSGLIAVLVAYLDNQFYPVVLEKLSRKLQGHGYQSLLLMTEPGRQDDVVERILQYQVEGVIMASATLSSRLAGECISIGIPILTLNRYSASSPASSVTSDNIEGGRLIARHLVAGGHKRIAYIAGLENSSTNRDREAGFYKGLAEHRQTPVARAVGGYTFEGAAQAARDLLSTGNPPDAIFVANDHMAFAVMDVVRHEFGLRIPQDVSIAGYDDVPEASWKGYDLTSVSQSPQTMVDEAVGILLAQINDPSASRGATVLPAHLIVRSSTRPVKD